VAWCFTSPVCSLWKEHKLKIIQKSACWKQNCFFITVTCVAFDLAFPTFIMAAKVKYKRNILSSYHICDVLYEHTVKAFRET
jgi:hypothetical protein